MLFVFTTVFFNCQAYKKKLLKITKTHRKITLNFSFKNALFKQKLRNVDNPEEIYFKTFTTWLIEE